MQLINNDNEIIAISPEEYDQETDANDHHDTVEAFIDQLVIGEKIFVVEHILLRPRKIVSDQDKEQDVLLSVCLDKDCNLCGNEDPYSFRITIVLNGEYGIANNGIAFRKFAEKTIRKETPAHLGVKICWVSENQLLEFESAYCAWLEELAKEESDNILLRQRLITLLKVFKNLKSVYPQATLHDCIDGDDENPVTLDNTII